MRTPDIETRIAIDRGADTLDIIRKALLRAAHDVAQLQARYAETDSPGQMAGLVSESIEMMAGNLLPSLRLDLAANALAELATAAARAQVTP